MYSRLSKVVLRQGSKRPEVFLYQRALGKIYSNKLKADSIFGPNTLAFTKRFQNEKSLHVDGKVGKEVWTTLLNLAVEDKFDFRDLFPLKKRVASLICLFETGHKKDAYGFSEDDIGDGAGANYGVLQHNSLGSMKRLLSMAGRKDLLQIYESTDKSKVNEQIADWMGTAEGADAQDNYFDEVIYKKAILELKEIGIELPIEDSFSERIIAFMCDTITQNGTLFSNRRGPFLSYGELKKYPSFKRRYPELYYGEEWEDYFEQVLFFFKGQYYNTYEDVIVIYRDGLKGSWRDKNKQFIKGFVEKCSDKEKNKYWEKILLTFLAQVRSRCSARRYWRRVEARRMLYPNGTSVIHGGRVDLLHDYGIGDVEELPIRAFLAKDEEGHLVDEKDVESTKEKPSKDQSASHLTKDQ